MKSSNWLISLAALILLAGQLTASIIGDFDSINPSPFQYKDEKGSSLESAISDGGAERSNVLELNYTVATGGWAGWGIPLNGLDVSSAKYVSFFVKGEKGGESFELGIKDKNGAEKKILSNSYLDVTNKWQNVKIPLTSFYGVSLAKLESIYFNFTNLQPAGKIYIDNIGFEGGADMSVETARYNKVLIDGFERVNPHDYYTVRTGGDSSLSIASSRLLHDGDYSMEMEYVLATDRPWGTWVSAHWENGNKSLDWTGVKELKIWLKGDGSENVFRVNLYDADGEMWSYEDINVLKNTRWALVTMPVRKFIFSNASSLKNGVLDLNSISAFELSIVSKSQKAANGKIYVDQLYAVGDRINTARAAPPLVVENLRMAVPSIGNIDFSGEVYSEYFWSPEEAQKMLHWAKIGANGKVGNFSGRFEFASESQNFGDAARFSYTSDGLNRGSLTTQSPKVITPLIQVMGNNINPYVTNLTVGNLWFEYSPYTFALPPLGGWGWKGVTAEGDVKNVNYHAFYISQPYYSYAAGTRWTGYFNDWKVTAIGVHTYESAKVTGASQITGAQLSPSSDWMIKPVFDDTVGNIEVLRWFNSKQIQVQLLGGWNHFNRYATEDSTDVFHPVYGQQLSQAQKLFDPIYRARVETNELFFEGFRLALEHRYIGAEYKPNFRKEPSWFDDSDADQKGFNIQATKKYEGFIFSAEYDDLTRLSNSKYFRYRTNTGVGYYGYAGMDVALNYEQKREKYNFASSRSMFTTATLGPAGEKDWLNNIIELYVRNQLNDHTAAWFKIRNEDVDVLNESKTDHSISLFTKLEYFITTNAKVFAEYKTTVQPSWEPKGFPFDDNYAKVSFDLLF